MLRATECASALAVERIGDPDRNWQLLKKTRTISSGSAAPSRSVPQVAIAGRRGQSRGCRPRILYRALTVFQATWVDFRAFCKCQTARSASAYIYSIYTNRQQTYIYVFANSIQQNEILAEILWTWVCDINVSTFCAAITNRLWLCEQCEFNLFRLWPEIEYAFPAASPPQPAPPSRSSDGVMCSCWPWRMVIRSSCLGLASVSGGHWAVGFVNASWLMTYYDVRLIRSFSKWLPRPRSHSQSVEAERETCYSHESDKNQHLTHAWHWLRFGQNSVAWPGQSFVVINLKIHVY